LKLYNGVWVKTRLMGYLSENKMMSLAVWIQYSSLTDRETDGQAPTDI